MSLLDDPELQADIKRAIKEGKAALARVIAIGDPKQIAEVNAILEQLHNVITHLHTVSPDRCEKIKRGGLGPATKQ